MLGFWMDLRLNATRRSVNLSVYLVFDFQIVLINTNSIMAPSVVAVVKPPMT